MLKPVRRCVRIQPSRWEIVSLTDSPNNDVNQGAYICVEMKTSLNFTMEALYASHDSDWLTGLRRPVPALLTAPNHKGAVGADVNAKSSSYKAVVFPTTSTHQYLEMLHRR